MPRGEKPGGLLFVLGALSLAGCVSMLQQQALVQPYAPARPMVAVGTPGQRVFDKTVAAGTSVILVAATPVSPDCSAASVPVARVTHAPAHGTVQIVDREAFPNFPANNPRFACNNRKFPSVIAEYKPAPGFVGSDLATVEYVSEYGKDTQLKFLITVK